MTARLRLWWQSIKQHPAATVLISLGALLVVLVLLGGYKLNWGWAGFNGSNKSGKTLWDWMQLLFIPFVLAVAGFWFNHREREAAELRAENERKAAELRAEAEQEIEKQRAKTEQEIAFDHQRGAALQAYINSMSELLLHEKLRESEPGNEIRNIARVRTLTVLSQLDNRRKNVVLTFLREIKLVTSDPTTTIISFSSMDLRRVDFKEANLSDIDLSRATLSKADLAGATICRTNLSQANLTGANLSDTYIEASKFNEADLSKTNFHKAYLNRVSFAGSSLHTGLHNATFSEAQFHEVDLSRTLFERADLSGAWFSDGTNFHESVFFEAILRGARLTNARLDEVDFTGADLREASLAGARLNKADLHGANLSGANMISAHLNGANLRKANLTYANLGGAILDSADLRDALLDVDELEKRAKSLKGATMPNGSVHP